ncbi:MAG: hypothetical protein R3E56_10885 [Burkholderiaceae bacterium]
MAKARYDGGTVDFIAVLDSQRSYLQARRDFTASRGRLNTQFVTVNKVLGSVPEMPEQQAAAGKQVGNAQLAQVGQVGFGHLLGQHGDDVIALDLSALVANATLGVQDDQATPGRALAQKGSYRVARARPSWSKRCGA